MLDNPLFGVYSTQIGSLYEYFVMVFTSIGDALFTKTQQRVLALLYGKPDRRFYTNEIVRLVAMGRGTVSRELERLVSSGLLVVTKEGNQHYYQANHNNPIYQELLAIVRKTFGIVDVLGSALRALDDKIDLSFVYGSIAKKEETASSDVDLFIVSELLTYTDVMVVLSDTEQLLDRPINPSIYAKEQIKTKLSDKNSFLTRVLEQPKLWIKGTDNDINELREFSKN